MKVLLHHEAGFWLREQLQRLAGEGLDIFICPASDDAAFRGLLAHTEVLWHVLRPLSAADLAAAPKLRLIQKIGVGVNTIDLDEAGRRGIAVCNMPGTNSRAVAELALALMLACLRRLPQFDALTKAGGGWSWPTEWQGSLGEIADRTVGLVGAGAVPQLLAPILEAMGACVLYTSRRPEAQMPGAHVGKAELLAKADIVSLHIPLSDETALWLDAAAISTMKPRAILINTARGGLVDESALCRALQEGRLAAAGLDVFADEPVPANHSLLSLGNVVTMPHVAWLTTGTIERSLSVAVENCQRLATNEPLLHRVI